MPWSPQLAARAERGGGSRRQPFPSPANMELVADDLHVRLEPLPEPRRSRAIAGLCEELNATGTIYRGTKLRLVYSVKGEQMPTVTGAPAQA